MDTASRLLAPSRSESDLRSSISRAYYACYQTIRIEVNTHMSIQLRQQAGLGGKILDHGKLCMALKGCNTTADIGTHLENLKTARHSADYDLAKVIDFRKADDNVNDAKALLAEISVLGGAAKVVQILRAHLQAIHGML